MILKMEMNLQKRNRNWTILLKKAPTAAVMVKAVMKNRLKRKQVTFSIWNQTIVHLVHSNIAISKFDNQLSVRRLLTEKIPQSLTRIFLSHQNLKIDDFIPQTATYPNKKSVFFFWKDGIKSEVWIIMRCLVLKDLSQQSPTNEEWKVWSNGPRKNSP